jgi:uncharacterized LabA/DUF88 family protein
MIKSKKNNNTAVLIDDAYLSKVSKQLGNGVYLKFSHHKFAIKLAQQAGLWCDDIYFYTSPPFQSSPPTEEESRRKSGYDQFIKKLQTQRPTTWVREGRCQKIGGIFKQKGVDNLIMIDLLRIAQRKQFDSVILVTSDTDFVPSILEIKKEYGIKIILGYYTDGRRRSKFSLSDHLHQIADSKILLDINFFA